MAVRTSTGQRILSALAVSRARSDTAYSLPSTEFRLGGLLTLEPFRTGRCLCVTPVAPSVDEREPPILDVRIGGSSFERQTALRCRSAASTVTGTSPAPMCLRMAFPIAFATGGGNALPTCR